MSGDCIKQRTRTSPLRQSKQVVDTWSRNDSPGAQLTVGTPWRVARSGPLDDEMLLVEADSSELPTGPLEKDCAKKRGNAHEEDSCQWGYADAGLRVCRRTTSAQMLRH